MVKRFAWTFGCRPGWSRSRVTSTGFLLVCGQVDWAIAMARHFAFAAGFRKTDGAQVPSRDCTRRQAAAAARPRGQGELDFHYLRDGETASSGRVLFVE